jgi:hypothetical protein
VIFGRYDHLVTNVEVEGIDPADPSRRELVRAALEGDVSNECRQMAKAFADLTVEPVAVAAK